MDVIHAEYVENSFISFFSHMSGQKLNLDSHAPVVVVVNPLP